MKSIINGCAVIARIASSSLRSILFALRRLSVTAATVFACAAMFIASEAMAQTVVLRVDGENGGLPQGSPHNGTADGSDWGNKAFLYLQDALTKADTLLDVSDPPDTVEIWVAAVEDGSGNPVGYRPDQDADNQSGTDDPDATFDLRENVHIYGGFEGDPSEDDVDDSDPENNVINRDRINRDRSHFSSASVRARRTIGRPQVIDSLPSLNVR